MINAPNDSFDPNGPGLKNGKLFGLPMEETEAEVIVIPVPWDVTVSYGSGTHQAPEAILEASSQVDLYHPIYPESWEFGIAMLPIDEELRELNTEYRQVAEHIIKKIELGRAESSQMRIMRNQINQACETMIDWVENQTQMICEAGKIPCVLGGDHSSPLGLIRGLGHYHDSFGIVQIDAHADLRESYEGFRYSHASIMYNALQLSKVEQLVQVGVRDYCDEEIWRIKEDERIHLISDLDLQRERYQGKTWHEQVLAIVDLLPEKVYISFDIDGLDPSLCPHTGTPVPGGLQFEEAIYLVDEIVAAGIEIIGFDLCEVCPNTDDWDANVGARVLYRLFAASVYSRS